jgi:hypothetical protein
MHADQTESFDAWINLTTLQDLNYSNKKHCNIFKIFDKYYEIQIL